MTLTLTNAISATATVISITGTVPAVIDAGYHFRLDDELLELTGFVSVPGTRRTYVIADRQMWYVRRGLDASDPASHTAGTAILGAADAFVAQTSGETPPSPFTTGGGGQTTDVQAALDGANAPDAGNVFATMADVGGGSTPGAVRWLGPCKIGAFDGVYIYGYSAAEGGTFTLTVNGETTAAIAFNAGAAAIRSALEALPSIGAGHVVVTLEATSLVDGYGNVVFKDALATDLMTGDGTNLTGAGAPYTVGMEGAVSWFVEMFTPAVGDIIEDFLHSVVTDFDTGDDPRLFYTDDVVGTPAQAAPAWSMPISGQGVDGLDLGVGSSDFTNFFGNGDGGDVGDARSRPTALTALIAGWTIAAADTTINLYQNLPAVVRNAVPIYSYVRDIVSAPTAGEVWIWVKVSTPAPLMD